MADELEKKLAKDMWLGGQQPSQADREAIEQFAEAPSPATHPNVFAWYCLCSKFNPTVRASWAGAKAAAAPKADKKKAEPKKEEAKKEVKAEDDDDFDPFASEEEDPEAEKAKMERMKEIAKTAKSYGKAPAIAKSIIVWEVKPWGEETDLKELADKIIAIEMDGLFWKTEWKKEPIAYGVFKIIIGATIEDDKVSTDEVQEKIEAMEDLVQSVDIQAFNKL
jgi:elongation factor 1-beta